MISRLDPMVGNIKFLMPSQIYNLNFQAAFFKEKSHAVLK